MLYVYFGTTYMHIPLQLYGGCSRATTYSKVDTIITWRETIHGTSPVRSRLYEILHSIWVWKYSYSYDLFWIPSNQKWVSYEHILVLSIIESSWSFEELFQPPNMSSNFFFQYPAHAIWVQLAQGRCFIKCIYFMVSQFKCGWTTCLRT